MTAIQRQQYDKLVSKVKAEYVKWQAGGTADRWIKANEALDKFVARYM